MRTELIAENVFIQKHPLSLLGCRMGRVVTLLRLSSGKALIHSTAGFSESDVREIQELGEPGYLLDATNFHDTTSSAGRTAFPEIPYYVPAGFSAMESLQTRLLSEFDSGDELAILPICGIPKLNEHALFHRESKTLILADLFFNLPESVGGWTKWFLKTTVGLKAFPGQSRFFQRFIEDKEAYRESLEKILEFDFENIIVGHGEPVLKDAKAVFQRVLLST